MSVGTVIVSASLLGPSFGHLVSSLVLVLVTRPFDVGDRVVVSGVLNDELLLVVRRRRPFSLARAAAAALSLARARAHPPRRARTASTC